MQRRSVFWLATSFLLWTLFGVFSAFLTHFRSSFSKHPYSWPSSLAIECSYAYVAGALSPAIIWLARRFPPERSHLIRNLSIHLVCTGLYAAVAKALWDQLRFPMQATYLTTGFTFAKFLQSLNYGLDSGVLLYWVVLLTVYAHDYYRSWESGLLQSSQLQAQLAKAQLQALKMQLQPHFLFNALHTASALVQDDPAGAERVLARLSDLLRSSLENSATQEVPLIEELKILDLYLDIERTRFEDRLAVSFEIEAETEDALVPNLILQPLVENSIKHGISRRAAGGEIAVRTARELPYMVIRVTDNGPGMGDENSPQIREGVGLSTTKARLERLYGNKQQLTLQKFAAGGFEVIMKIPFKTALQEAHGTD